MLQIIPTGKISGYKIHLIRIERLKQLFVSVLEYLSLQMTYNLRYLG